MIVAITERDKRILMVLVVVVLLAGYWLLVLKPLRSEISDLNDKVAAKSTEVDTAKLMVGSFSAMKASYASDYTTVVSLGKAVPADADIPSLMVQLDSLMGKKLDFSSVSVQDYPPQLLAPSTSPTPDTPSEWPPAIPAAGSSDGASTSSGAATSSSGTKPVSAEQPGSSAGGSQAGGATTGSGSSANAASVTGGLPFVPVKVSFVFDGNFFKMYKFFEDVHRFVRESKGRIVVGGRLVFIEGFSFEHGRGGFPDISGKLDTIVFSLPGGQDLTMGATQLAPEQGAAQQVSGEGKSKTGLANPSATSIPPKP